MSIASAAPFSGLSRPANIAPGPAVADQGWHHARVRRQNRVDRDDPAPGAGLEFRYDGHGGRSAAPGHLAQRRRHGPSGGRWTVCTTGARSAVASLTAGASKA